MPTTNKLRRFIMAKHSSPSETQEEEMLRLIANLVVRLQKGALRFTNASAYCRVSGWQRTAEQLTRMVQDFDHRAQMIQYGLEADQREMKQNPTQAIEEHIEF
jgi:hypothetical protein